MMERITSLRETGFRAAPSTGRYASVEDYYLADESQDLRGRSVLQDGRASGVSVAEMLVDPDDERVALLELTDGRRIPIEKVRLQGSYVRIDG